jgi:mannose-6-phosphate isomerase-like protein (cupin superfamily)
VTREPELARLGAQPDAIAPDGSEVRLLLGLEGGGMAHFRLGAGETAAAVRHGSVEELWFVVRGRGEMWRRFGGAERVDELEPDVCLSIPVGTEFQFRSVGPDALEVVAVTMPPWPGSGEAIAVDGPWEPTVPRGPS